MIAFVLVIGLTPIAVAAPLNGEISEEGEARVPRADGNVSDQMPEVAPDRRNGSAQASASDQGDPLVGNIADFASPTRRNNPPQSAIVGSAQNQLSALGIAFKFGNGKVTFVDPGSDLFGKIFAGDRILSYDGVNPVESYRTGGNFGSAGSVVQLTFERDGVVTTLPCRRKPITEFSPAFQSELNWGALRR